MIGSILVMIAYFAFFAFVHSLLADTRFKSRAKKSYGELFDRWQRLVYSMLALLMMLPFIFIMTLLPDKMLYVIPAPWYWFVAAIQILAILALLATLRQTGFSILLGLAQLQGRPQANGLVTDGFYCHLRNPLFLFGAIILWLSPTMTLNLLAFNILATIYVYIGARHEERSLREEFGQEYEDYRQKVPMFLPRLKC